MITLFHKGCTRKEENKLHEKGVKKRDNFPNTFSA